MFYLIQGFGFSILYDPVGRIYIKLDPYYIGRVQGVCGNNDGNSDDCVSSTGLGSTMEDFFDSYKSVTCNGHPVATPDMKPCEQFGTVSVNRIIIC